MSEQKEQQAYAKGHRQRLRARYRLTGEAAVQDYELLELLLTYAIPRRDTKLIGSRILGRFGALAWVFEADPAPLEWVERIVTLDRCRPSMGRSARGQRGNRGIPRGW